MPTLDWIGKKAVLNHHNEVPFHLLRCDPELSVGEASGNLLVQGDNLLALKALLPYYVGQVKCIYIDPPYNTGNEGWVYNDNVNSPEMCEWLGKVVGGEAEDLSRHDKWLCMMYPRLVLLREMLREDGSLWMSIDDNEVQHARTILNEIFGSNNFVSTIVWQKRTSPDARLNLGPAHDYILVYAKKLEKLKPALNKIYISEERSKAYKNPDNDPRGPWASVDMTGQTGHATPDQYYDIVTPSGKVYKPPQGRCWAIAQSTFLKMVGEGRIWFGRNGTNRPRVKKYLSENTGTTTWTWWSCNEVGHNQEATKETNQIIGAGHFETPKPVRLLRRIIQIASNPGDLILDSFAGTGTTGHTVLIENSKSNMIPRKFILVEMTKNISKQITSVRLQRAINGYEWIDSKGNLHYEKSLGGGFRYCELGPTLFDANGQIRPDVSFADLARHVFFTETGQPLPAGEEENALLGECNGTAVYLLYNGVMRDAGNVLTPQTLAQLPPFDGPKVIYADGCKMGRERLREMGVSFKQIPYEIKVR